MNKILYISFLNEDTRPGYRNKIHSQVISFSEIEKEAFLLIMGNEGFHYYEYNNGIESSKKIKYFSHKRLNLKRNAFDEFFIFFEFRKYVEKIVNEKNISIVYIRRIVPITPFLIHMMKRIKEQGVYIIYEYPTYPWKVEMKKMGNTLVRRLFYCLDCMQFKSLIRIPDLIPYIGVYTGDDKRFYRIQNCGNARYFKLRNKKIRNEKIVLIAVAHASYTHGYDVVIEGLKKYYDSNPQRIVEFNIVGDVRGVPELEMLTKRYHLEDFIHFCGYATGKKLDNFYQEADIGVNVIRIEDKSIKQIGVTTLKTVEYTFRGIPQISGAGFSINGKNADIPPFLCIMDQDNFDVNSIISFYDNLLYSPNEIREYAVKYFSWESIFKGMLSELRLDGVGYDY